MAYIVIGEGRTEGNGPQAMDRPGGYTFPPILPLIAFTVVGGGGAPPSSGGSPRPTEGQQYPRGGGSA